MKQLTSRLAEGNSRANRTSQPQHLRTSGCSEPEKVSTLCPDSDKTYIYAMKICPEGQKKRQNRPKSSNGLCSRLSSRGAHAYSGTDEGGATCFRTTNSGY
jgi:hypothetical protein